MDQNTSTNKQHTLRACNQLQGVERGKFLMLPVVFPSVCKIVNAGQMSLLDFKTFFKVISSYLYLSEKYLKDLSSLKRSVIIIKNLDIV